MSFEVGVEVHFTASHHLVGDFGPACLPHSHAYRVQVSVSGDKLRADGTLFDITQLQRALAQVIGDLDGTNLNDLSPAATTIPTPPQLRQAPSAQDPTLTLTPLFVPNPTAEVVARHFFQRIAAALSGQGLARLEARVWESPEAFGGYNGDLA